MTTALHLRDLDEAHRAAAWTTIRDRSIDNPRATELRTQAVEVLTEHLAEAADDELVVVVALMNEITEAGIEPTPSPVTEFDRRSASITASMSPEELRAAVARLFDQRRTTNRRGAARIP
jgi:hypothetical protein